MKQSEQVHQCGADACGRLDVLRSNSSMCDPHAETSSSGMVKSHKLAVSNSESFRMEALASSFDGEFDEESSHVCVNCANMEPAPRHLLSDFHQLQMLQQACLDSLHLSLVLQLLLSQFMHRMAPAILASVSFAILSSPQPIAVQ